jgi:hypothetical protein
MAGPGSAGLVGTPSTLLTGLVSHYTLDETGGTRADSLGTYDLGDNGTTLSATGKVDTCASFVQASSQFLSVDAGAGNEIVPANASDTYTVAFWVYFKMADHTSGNYFLYADNGTNNEFSLFASPVTTPVFRCQIHDGVALKQVQVTEAQGLVDDAWNHAIMWMDGVDLKLYMSVNGGATQSSSALAGSPRAFRRLGVAARPNSAAHQDCKIDELALWSRALTADERTSLNNTTLGRRYPFT